MFMCYDKTVRKNNKSEHNQTFNLSLTIGYGQSSRMPMVMLTVTKGQT